MKLQVGKIVYHRSLDYQKEYRIESIFNSYGTDYVVVSSKEDFRENKNRLEIIQVIVFNNFYTDDWDGLQKIRQQDKIDQINNHIMNLEKEKRELELRQKRFGR